jgi:signal transduction histidine kinase/DNA-binding response OmpR family regulator
MIHFQTAGIGADEGSMNVTAGHPPRRRWEGVEWTVGLAVLLHLLEGVGLKLPNAPAVLALGVVYAALRGGALPGAVAGLVAFAETLWVFRPAAGWTYGPEQAGQVVVWAICFAAMVGIVSRFKRRSDRNLGHLRSARASAELIQRHQGFVQHLPLGVLVYRLEDPEDDCSLTLMDGNPAAATIVKLDLAEAQGKTILELFPTAMLSNAPRRFAEVVRSGRPHELGEVIYGDSRLPQRAYAVKAFPLPDQCVGVVFEDASERVRARQLKDEFVSMVSHELRTPLTSIRGAVGLIASGSMGAVPERAGPLLDIASKNCERLAHLINDILDTQKIELNKLEFRYATVELEDLVARAVEAHAPFADQYGIRLVVRDGAPGAKLRVDPDRLFQVLSNLLSNAVKFSPEGGVVSIRTIRAEGRLRVEVEDRGPGIPETFRHRIFEKFSQADSSSLRPKGGSGLGLNIARAMVERMGGSIGFQSKEGEGSTFFVEFLDSFPLNAAPRKGPRVLVLEDDGDVATLLGLVLKQEGLAFDIAHDAEQAKVLLAERSYVAMTVDLLLPGQSGLSLIRELRNEEATRSLPIVVVSAVAAEGKQDLNGAAFGIVDWLDKPLNLVRLTEAVHRAVRQGASDRPRILHVEDDPDLLHVVATLLESLARMDGAKSLAEARQKLSEQRPDLVILDLTLPDGHGFELLPDLEKICGGPVPVILFSAAEVPEEVLARVSGAFLKAKSPPEDLARAIKAMLA